MKIDTDSLTYIRNVVETAQLIGIDDVIIEPGLVRAINEEKSVVIFQDTNVPDMLFNSIGLNRIGVFLSRLDIVKTQDNFTVDVRVDDESEFVRSITMKGTGVSVDYRCANPRTIQAPKRINDEQVCTIQLTAEAVYLLQKAQAAMGADTVSVISNDKGVTFELVDVNSDKFSHTFAKEVKTLTEDADKIFVHKYPIKILLSLFRDNSEGTFSIGKKGMLNVIVNNLNIYVIPQV